MTNLVALPEGTELAGDFRIERVLGAGGFGVTYLAQEIALARKVTIKEYFPSDFAARATGSEAAPRSEGCVGDYQWGLERFIEEAQTLAKFTHPNIVRVYRYFRANNTGYMVLHFEEGQSLKGWLKSLGRAARQQELDKIVAPLLDALEVIHKADFLHRDIAPDNIIIRKTGEPVLIDFGSARGEIAAHSRTVSALVKPGYSPYEQYAETSRQQGPWTDIYALGATLYHAVTGKRPPDAPSRMVKDEIVPAREAALSSYRAGFLRAIDKALALGVEQRPQSVAAWRGELLAPDPARASWIGRGKDTKGKKAASAAAPEQAPPATPAQPPQPDAPGPQGGLLDFVDGLKQKVSPGPAAAAKPPEAAPAAARDERAGESVAQAATVKVEPPPAVKLPKVVEKKDEAERRKPARPRPIGGQGRGPRWRGLLAKLVIGAGIAGAAVALQDKIPRLESNGTATGSSRIEDTAPIAVLKGHRGAVGSVAFSDDGRTIVTTGADSTLRIWSGGSGQLQRTLDLVSGPATAFAMQGRRGLTGHGEGQITLWDLERGEKLQTFKRNEASVWSLAFAGSPDRFAAAGHDWRVALWDAKSGAGPVHVLDGHESAAQALAFSRREQLLASGGADKSVKLWKLDTLELVRTYKGAKDFISALVFSPDGKTLVAASLDGSIRLWSTASNRLVKTLNGHKGAVTGLSFSASGDYLASAGEDGSVRVWDLKKGRTVRAITGHSGPVKAVAFAPDGQRIVSAADDGTAKVWAFHVPKPQKDGKDKDKD